MRRRGVEQRGAVGRRSASSPTTLLQRLRERFAPGGLAALRPGQVVSGRAAAALGARRATGARDGEPLWRDDALVADARRAGPRDRRSARGRFIDALAAAPRAARRLRACPRYEDVSKVLLDESDAAGQRRSARRTTCRSRRERARLARLLARGHRQCRGLRAAAAGRRRRGCRDGVALGDEPVAAAARAPVLRSPAIRRSASACRSRRCRTCCPRTSSTSHAPDPFATPDALRKRDDAAACTADACARRQAARGDQDRARRRGARRPSVRLHAAGDARSRTTSALVAAIEATRATARRCRCSSRATRRRAIRACALLRVTPDPGVIEVNVHPASTWRELVDTTRTLYEEARQARLGDREVHARRPPHRHRRRQSRHARRRRRRPTARCCAGPTCCRA